MTPTPDPCPERIRAIVRILIANDPGGTRRLEYRPADGWALEIAEEERHEESAHERLAVLEAARAFGALLDELFDPTTARTLGLFLDLEPDVAVTRMIAHLQGNDFAFSDDGFLDPADLPKAADDLRRVLAARPGFGLSDPALPLWTVAIRPGGFQRRTVWEIRAADAAQAAEETLLRAALERGCLDAPGLGELALASLARHEDPAPHAGVAAALSARLSTTR